MAQLVLLYFYIVFVEMMLRLSANRLADALNAVLADAEEDSGLLIHVFYFKLAFNND